MIAIKNLLLMECLGVRARSLHCSSTFLKRGNSAKMNQPSESQLKDLLDNASVGSRQKIGDQKWLKSPFQAEKVRDQGLKVNRPKIDPHETSIILFPGQGVQHVGMGKPLLKLPQVEKMYKVANEILGYDLLKLCLNGPQDQLDQTLYCQPAIYVASLAALQLMIEERQVSVESCVATAGFSIGEYASLVLANCFSFETGLKLVKARAEAMQEAAGLVESGMATLFLDPAAKIGTILNTSLEWCRNTGVERPHLSVANYLYPNCLVIAGSKEALRFIELNTKELKIRRCRHIAVSAAFHTPLMKSASELFRNELKKYHIADPQIAVHSNIDGLPYRDAIDIQKKLVRQIYRPVKWEQTMHVIYDRKKDVAFPQTFELGPGKSLTTLLRYCNANAAKHSVNIFA
ncbi:probable malonyl-CoA-acyl carrier protein transacylase, mitochondrial [Thrips palmi]|uniref:Probable malonyl-CoA-acyl carrier protein transacylase, mitochondrial n=1 Tax=Thrips palmi TaxID=161013 RepID=A0A6P9A9M6_THRPL|nr:probable malonyl-CoA-acyl carrier protein transacylase, mitochondrial [Thrips palmi]